MSLLYQNITPFPTYKVPNEVEEIMVTPVNLCFTCAKIKTFQECTSVVLECQGLECNAETKSSILQVICQLLRVQWGSLELESLILRDGNLPFCPCCLKVITEIIILREKLLHIETEIRERLRKLEVSVAGCFQNCGDDMKEKSPEEGSIKYDDLRIMFQTQVMEEYFNKRLVEQKILEMNQDPRVIVPSLTQFHFEKNVFSIAERKQPLEVKEIETSIKLSDASTDTKDLEILEEKSIQVGRNSEIFDDELPPVLEVQVPHVHVVENFSLVPVRQESNTSDDSDYGSPSKKSKTDVVLDAPPQVKKSGRKVKKNGIGTKQAVPSKQPSNKISNAKTKLKKRKPFKSQSEKFNPVCSNGPWMKNNKELDPVPSVSSKQQKTARKLFEDSGEHFEDNEGDGSDCLLEEGESQSSESGSSDCDGDEADPTLDAVDDNDKVVDNITEDSPTPNSELQKKHEFKRKYSHHLSPQKIEIQHTFEKIVQEAATFTAKDKTVWTTKEPVQTTEARAHEILREDGGLIGPAKDSTLTPTEIFKLMFPPSIVETTVKHTNAYATHMYNKNPKKTPAGDVIKWSPVTVEEIYGYIGILLYLGVDKKRDTTLHDVWTTDERYAIPIIVATMSRDRFSKIHSFLRFDDKVSRMSSTNANADEGDSKFYYVSEVFEPFVENMHTHLRPYDTLVVDEMLIKFRGSAKFRVYMKSKPGKYGLKFWAVCDVETGYILKIALYEGKVGDQVEREHGKKVVLNLVQKYFGSGRGVTMDNFFTSKALGEELMKRKMSMLGTLNHNRMDVIPQLVNPKEREVFSSVFAFQGDFTMVSYVPKKNRAVLLLSTQHHSPEISTQHRYKPKMILDYNMTKSGVDIADQMIAASTCQRATTRWPMKVFQALLDIAAFNAFTVHKMHCSSTAVPPTPRKVFLRNLSEELMKPCIATRFQKPNAFVSMHMHKILKKLGYEIPEQETLESRIADAMIGTYAVNVPNGSRQVGKCHLCRKEKRKRSASSRCHACNKFVCVPCSVRPIHCRLPKCTFVLQRPAPWNYI